MDYGFKVVLSSRFADIFRGNAGKAGLLAALMDQQDIEQLWQQLIDQPGLSLTVNLNSAMEECVYNEAQFAVITTARERLKSTEGGTTLPHDADDCSPENSHAARCPTDHPVRYPR